MKNMEDNDIDLFISKTSRIFNFKFVRKIKY